MKYRIFAKETVFYTVEVEAKNEDEAIELVESGEIEVGEPSDGEDFHVTDFEVITEEEQSYGKVS